MKRSPFLPPVLPNPIFHYFTTSPGLSCLDLSDLCPLCSLVTCPSDLSYPATPHSLSLKYSSRPYHVSGAVGLRETVDTKQAWLMPYYGV